ncbi:MAG: DNA polymerase III subunit gamma and tau [Propionibacteriaceae bacterium]|nr:DNA polymerase III subunit gamma and tau [Propionibacteriaceae bacterium]
MEDQSPSTTTGPEFFTQDGPGLFLDAPTLSRPDAPLALYRRYRPETFSDVIGQEHVTEPLKRALSNNRVNHAYLFSGPRGCGKTSSARILARSLNCDQGPTPEPCGLCPSCQDLARGGPGSIDVLEIDAASHGGVDDARELRERAFFSPVRSRYRVYIVDEAHMVTTQGFNALLTLVEEPPPHVKFIFATTEPDKVIGTIRSRTHHYPFRLIPPKTMIGFLEHICAEESVSIDERVIQMVVRAGGGSVRDALSVLDQLMGGSSSEGVSYDHAIGLLGYTPDSLMDAVVEALSSGDSTGVFTNIDKVIEAGQDPRRFAEDLLTRLRDLMIVAAVPDATTSGLLDLPGDQVERYQGQANQMGIATLTRAAEVVAAGLSAMRGTTAPRLQVELMCARILLPASDSGERGIHARLEKLEKDIRRPVSPSPVIPDDHEETSPQPVSATNQDAVTPASSTPKQTPATAPSVTPPVDPPAPHAATPAPFTGDLTTEAVHEHWPQILAHMASIRRFVWTLLNQHVVETELRGDVLWVTFSEAGPRDHFNRSNGEELLSQAVTAHMNHSVKIRARLNSEPIPSEGTAILSLAPSASQPKTSRESPAETPGHSPQPTPEPTAPVESATTPTVTPTMADEDEPASEGLSSEDDEIVDNPEDVAAELVKELFDAELISEVKTKPAPRKKN